MEFHPEPSYNMLLTAGNKGMCALFSTGTAGRAVMGASPASPAPPALLYHFKAHAKWVSGARFVPAAVRADSMSVVTTADDGLVKVWDLAKQGKKSAQLLLASQEPHDRGIFALDVAGDTILTGSKDKTVCLSRLDAGCSGLAAESRFELHSGVVKSVEWCPGSNGRVFASGAQDRSVCVKDVRSRRPDHAEVEIIDAHPGGVHTVKWAPLSGAGSGGGGGGCPQYLLASSGMDPVVKVWDVRFPGTPLHVTGTGTGTGTGTCTGAGTGEGGDEEDRGEGGDMGREPLHCFQGHARTGAKAKTILSMCWLSPSVLATPGEKSDRLSLYCAASGRAISRGELGHEPNAVCPGGPGGLVAVATLKSGIFFLLPTYK
jgi:WD40 repeat protein